MKQTTIAGYNFELVSDRTMISIVNMPRQNTASQRHKQNPTKKFVKKLLPSCAEFNNWGEH